MESPPAEKANERYSSQMHSSHHREGRGSRKGCEVLFEDENVKFAYHNEQDLEGAGSVFALSLVMRLLRQLNLDR